MIDCQSSSSRVVSGFQKRDEQTMGSLQTRNQVRAEPDEERTADSSVVTGGSDPLHDFLVSSDEPNEEITEQWHDDLHEWYICRDDQCPVESTGISRDVSQKRGCHRFRSCLKRRFVSTSTNSQKSTQHECDSHSAAGDVGVVFSQKPSVVAWFQRSLCVLHLHIPAISGIAANGSSVVGQIATTTRMMCWYLLMVGITFCLDRAVHVFPVADARPTSCPCVDRQRGATCSTKMSDESC